jgi:hypothetical protein
MKNFRRLLELRSIIPVLTISLAFLGVSGFAQKLGFTAEQIILGLLGIIAIDTLVDRLGYLHRIEEGIKSLSGAVSKPPFLSREMLDRIEPFERFLGRGRDVLISGVALNSIAGPRREFFRRMILQGSHLRFLLLDPDSPSLGAIAYSHGMSPEALKSDILGALNHLALLEGITSTGHVQQGSIEVRLLQAIPNISIVMRDSDRAIGEIRCELHIYKTDTTERPSFRLTPDDEEIYRRYRDAIDRLWNDSKQWTAKKTI